MLNLKQKQVAEKIDKNILLAAPAGTGKTNTLSERVFNIINNNVAKEEEILCITFTNKAAKEMIDRIEKRLNGPVKCTIKTFHSFCLEIVRSNAKKSTDIATDFIIFDEEDAKEVINKIAGMRISSAFNYAHMNSSMLQKFIDLVKNYRLQFGFIHNDDKDDYRKTIDNLNSVKRSKLCDCFKDSSGTNMHLMKYLLKLGEVYVDYYNKALRADKGLDFNDIITFARILFEDESIVSYYKDKYKVINIDEMQDTSLADYEILEKLFKGDKSKNVLMCGDIFQTIYSFRGSNPEMIFKKFKEECSPLEIAFDINYRSTKTLTNASMNFLNNLFKGKIESIYKDGVSSESEEEGEKISLIKYDTVEAEALGILNKFKELKENGEDLSKACVLTRSNNYNKDISKVLKRLDLDVGFEFILVDEYKFFRRSEIKDIIAIFKILADASDSVSLERVLKRLNTGIGKVILEKMNSTQFRKARVKLSDFVNDKTSKGEFYTNLIDAYDSKNSDGNIVVFDVESTGVDITSDEIIQIAAIKIDNKGNVIDTYERFLKPRKSVGSSEWVHGFSDKFLEENGGDKETILKEFREYTKGKLVVGHNVQYDINIFTSELDRYNIGAPLFSGFYDTLDIYRRFYPTEKNHKLEYLSEIFGTVHKPSHDAMDDIKATKELLVMAIDNKIRNTSFERMSLIADSYKKFEGFREKYNYLKEKSYELRPYELILEIQKCFDIMSKYPQGEREERFSKIAQLHKILVALDEEEKSLRDMLISTIEMTGLSAGEIEERLTSTQDTPRIPIITVHQAKGLEFDNVIVAGLVKGLFPLFNGELDDEGKLFYVAITRAKKRLVLTYPNERAGRNGLYKSEISLFTEMIGEEFIEIL